MRHIIILFFLLFFSQKSISTEIECGVDITTLNGQHYLDPVWRMLIKDTEKEKFSFSLVNHSGQRFCLDMNNTKISNNVRDTIIDSFLFETSLTIYVEDKKIKAVSQAIHIPEEERYVTFYDKINYEGNSSIVKHSIEEMDIYPLQVNVKSLKLPTGWSMELYRNSHFTGERQDINSSAPSLHIENVKSFLLRKDDSIDNLMNNDIKSRNRSKCDVYLVGAKHYQIIPLARTSNNSFFHNDNVEWDAYIYKSHENKNVCFSVKNTHLRDLIQRAFYFGFPLTINTDLSSEVTSAEIAAGYEVSEMKFLKDARVCVKFIAGTAFAGAVVIDNEMSSAMGVGNTYCHNVHAKKTVRPSVLVFWGKDIYCPEQLISGHISEIHYQVWGSNLNPHCVIGLISEYQ